MIPRIEVWWKIAPSRPLPARRATAASGLIVVLLHLYQVRREILWKPYEPDT